MIVVKYAESRIKAETGAIAHTKGLKFCNTTILFRRDKNEE
jgi:hypothetical protein